MLECASRLPPFFVRTSARPSPQDPLPIPDDVHPVTFPNLILLNGFNRIRLSERDCRKLSLSIRTLHARGQGPPSRASSLPDPRSHFPSSLPLLSVLPRSYTTLLSTLCYRLCSHILTLLSIQCSLLLSAVSSLLLMHMLAHTLSSLKPCILYAFCILRVLYDSCPHASRGASVLTIHYFAGLMPCTRSQHQVRSIAHSYTRTDP